MPPESGFLLGVPRFMLLLELFTRDRKCLLPLPSNCYHEEQRKVYRVEQPPERGIIDAAREWVSTRSGRIFVVDRASDRRGRRKSLLSRQLRRLVNSSLPPIASLSRHRLYLGEERMSMGRRILRCLPLQLLDDGLESAAQPKTPLEKALYTNIDFFAALRMDT
nr:hypothetical protein Itr_chr01CG06390 [Ipomoea trifida]